MQVLCFYKVGNVTSLRYVNFAFNYQKVKSFQSNMTMAGDLNGYSQTYQMAAMSDGLPEMWKGSNLFNENDIGWLSHWDGKDLINPSITIDKTLILIMMPMVIK